MADSQINGLDRDNNAIALATDLGGGKHTPYKAVADGMDFTQGAKADAAASSDTGTFSLIALTKRLLQRMTTLITTLTDGSQIVKPFAATGSDWSYAAASGGIVSSTTAVTIKTAAGSGVRNYITSVQIAAAALSAANELLIRDGAGGTVLFRAYLSTTGVREGGYPLVFPVPLKGSANTLLEIALTASTTGGVYVNAQGYSA